MLPAYCWIEEDTPPKPRGRPRIAAWLHALVEFGRSLITAPAIAAH